MSKQSKPLHFWWVVVAMLVLGGVSLAALSRRPEGLQPPAAAPVSSSSPSVLTVKVAPARVKTLRGSLEVSGTVSPRDQLSLGSEVGGLRIVAVYVKEGDEVHRGEPLARLDSSVLRAQLDQQLARLKASRAAAAKAVQPNRPQDIAGLRAALAQARANEASQQANLAQARATLEDSQSYLIHYRALCAQGAVSQQDLVDRQTAQQRDEALVRAAREQVRAAHFAVEQAIHRLALAESGGMPEDITSARAAVEEAEASVEQLRAQLAQTVIRAPDSGWILTRDAHLGDIVSVGKVLFVMARQSRLELWAKIAQTDLGHVSRGDPVSVKLDNGRSVTGHVRDVEPMVDQKTRLATVRITLPVQAHVRPGMFLEGKLKGKSRRALMIPSPAVLGSSDGFYVMLYRKGTARRKKVTLGSRSGDLVEVVSGLAAGQKVITSGGAFLSDGDHVALAPSAGASAQ